MQYLLDGLISQAEEPRVNPGVEFDVSFTVNRTVYWLNSQSCQFSRTENGETLYGDFTSFRTQILMNLGLASLLR